MQNLYTGSAGQAAVMSEFLFRGYNVAVPEVDRGEDLFVVEDSTGNLSRIQVKAAIGKAHRKRTGYSAQVIVPIRQLQRAHTPELDYVFVLRDRDRWADFVVISRVDLYNQYARGSFGSQTKADGLLLTLVVDGATLKCSGVDLSAYLRAFTAKWPVIKH